MTSTNRPTGTRDEGETRLVRNIAAAGLAHDICGEMPAWDQDVEFRLENLPVDEFVWHGVVVFADVALPVSGVRMRAPFLVWMADDDPVSVHAILERDPAPEVPFALMNAIVAPVLGIPRRPRRVFVESPAMADALRNGREHVGHELTEFIEIQIERDADVAELARAYVQIQADFLAPDDAE